MPVEIVDAVVEVVAVGAVTEFVRGRDAVDEVEPVTVVGGNVTDGVAAAPGRVGDEGGGGWRGCRCGLGGIGRCGF